MNFELETIIGASADVVWDRVTTSAGINDELRPILRMTVPPRSRDVTLTDAVLGERVFRSWLLLPGVLPIGYDDVTVVERGPGLRFREVSPMTGMRHWEHERSVVPDGDCSRLHDRITFELAAPLRWFPSGHRLTNGAMRTLFRHRHRNATFYFASIRRGSGEPPSPPEKPAR